MTIGRLEKCYPEEWSVKLIFVSSLIGRNTKTFIFEGNAPRKGIQTYYSDIQMIGKYCILYSPEFKTKKRQYTLCNCMMPKIYK